MEDKMVQIFEEMGGDLYDKNNAAFRPVFDNIKVLNSIILKDLPKDARILSVGIGTGEDIINLGEQNPGWTFVGVEPAKSMLDKCRSKLEKKGLLDRCTLHNGYLDSLNSSEKFDAVICLFVLHFVKGLDAKKKMFCSFSNYLNNDGILIMTEISVDIKSCEYSQLIENWKGTHALTGASEEALSKVPEMIEEVLGVIPPEKTAELLKDSGFPIPIAYFQSFLIRGWYGVKRD